MAQEGPLLVVAKKSLYQTYGVEREDPHFLAMVREDNPWARQVMAAHRENEEALASLERYLAGRGVAYEKRTRCDGNVDGRFSLVIALGGDGTLLAASHAVMETPVVGINSQPGSSVGHFCSADRRDFAGKLDSILSGQSAPLELMRMEVLVNDTLLGPPALNDILFAAASPAASTSYRLRVAGTEELQRSSGIWIATPAGSTGAMCAAGGEQRPLSDARMQYLVREPYGNCRTTCALRHGFFKEGLRIVNLTPEGRIFLDGSRLAFTLNYGDAVEPRVSSHPLRIHK
jgi:NAD+ kinase